MKTIAAESSAFRQLQRVLRACLSIALLASAADAASPWRFWTKADGLPESVVFGLTADGAGRIIVKSGDVATLSILDGYQVTEIPVPHAYGRILPSSNHELWTFDSNGIDVRDGAEWRRYPDAQIADFATRSGMLQTRWFTYSVFYGPHDRMDVAPFRNETAVLMFPDRLVEWDRRNGSKRILRLAAQTGLGKFRDVQNTRDGALWLTGEHGVAMLRGSGAGIDWIEIPGPPADRDFMYPIEGENHELFVSATRLGGKRVVLRLAKGLWTEVYAADIALPRLKGWRGPGGTIWIQENRKIFQLNAGNPAVSASTNGKAIAGLTTAVLTQPDQSFWLGTTAGAARYSLPLWRTPNAAAWTDDGVSAIAEDRGGCVWFIAGRYLLREDHGVWTRYPLPAGSGDAVLTDNIVPLASGNLAILANSLHNVTLFHPSSGRFEVIANTEGKSVGWMAARRAGGAWVQRRETNGTRWTLDIFRDGKFHSSGLPVMTEFSDLKAILETRNGDIWLAATNAAGRIRNGKLHMMGVDDGYIDTGTFSLAETDDGSVLLGGRESITKFDGKRFQKLHDIDLAESICIDSKGLIWAASGSGLHRYRAGEWIANGVEEGLQADAVRKVFADSQGRLWAGTGQGISLYYPTADPDPPVTRIVDDRNLRETPPDGRVRLAFSGIDKWKVTPSDRLLFSWRMDDSAWSEFTGAEFASFEDLKGGGHRFEVRAMDRNGNIDPSPAAYEFSVLFPWYRQTYFILLSMFAAFIIAALARLLWRHHARLKYESLHDPLTGLANRTVFDRHFQEAINDAQHRQTMAAVVLLDLDRFKPINDTLGHAIGDLFLQEVGRRLRAAIRKNDTLARLGGDEFAIVMPSLRDREEAEAMAQRLLEAIRQPYRIESFELSGSASIGVSLFPEHGRDTSSLRRLADVAMYQCKSRNKDQYVVFDAEVGRIDFEAAQMASLITEALEKRYFHLHYQPLKDASGRLTGFEALIRLDHPQLGALGPDDFIGIAERTGLIIRVGDWVLKEACRQTAQWHRSGHCDLHINVNVSSVQLMKSDYADNVIAMLEKTGLTPSALTLEITETQMVRNIRDSASQIAKLRALGVTIALDDFGTGYSTLGSLDSLPVDWLKTDRSFVRQMDGNGNPNIAVIEAVATLAHRLGIRIVAEGIESASQLGALRAVGCDLFQGYHLGRPVPASIATAWLNEDAVFSSTLNAFEAALTDAPPAETAAQRNQCLPAL